MYSEDDIGDNHSYWYGLIYRIDENSIYSTSVSRIGFDDKFSQEGCEEASNYGLNNIEIFDNAPSILDNPNIKYLYIYIGF